MRIALMQMPLVVGDIADNVKEISMYAHAAHAHGADVICFPEMTLVGYPPEDLVFRQSFRDASEEALEKLATTVNPDIAVIVGYLGSARDPRGFISSDTDLGTNSAAFLYGGKVQARYHKHHLPTYGVFDEARYFRPGFDMPIVRFRGIDIAMTICEDAWQKGTPFTAADDGGAQVIFSLNGSPYETGKSVMRRPLISQRAREAAATVCYVNQVGGQDELVFDGDSFVVNEKGEEVATAALFHSQMLMYDMPEPATVKHRGFIGRTDFSITKVDVNAKPWAPLGTAKPPARSSVNPFRPTGYEEMWTALVTGLRGYIDKNGFKSVVLGVSGGIDSAVCAALAADAIGGRNVYGIALPSEWSSDGSLSDAEELMQSIGGNYRIIPIKPMMDAYHSGIKLTGIAAENLQARIRGTILMGASNEEGHLTLAPGNKSELAVGYSTIYGDAVGGYGPIKDVYKTHVFELARWRYGQGKSIPWNSIEKPPSAELAPGQQDTDSLPPYDVLDDILHRYIEQDQGAGYIAYDTNYPDETVRRVVGLVDRAEWKRRQYPPGTKISVKNFGRDRRVPITNRWRELSG